MNNKVHTGIRCAFLAGALLAAGAAQAYSGATVHISNMSLPKVEVVGNGVEYTAIKPALAGYWQAHLNIQADGAARIKSWKLWPYKGQGIGSPELNLKPYAASQSYSVGNRPTSVQKNVGHQVPLAALASHAIARCNTKAEILRSQGWSDAQIFAQNHTVAHDDLVFGVEIDLTVGNKNLLVEGSYHPYQVVCLKHDPTPQVSTPATITSGFTVNGASLAIAPGHKIQTACPVELDFNGTIHTAGTLPTTVQYRFEWPTGEKSTVFSAHVQNPAQGVQVAHKVKIPLPGAAGVGGSGGGSGQAPGGFAQVQQPRPPPGPLPEAVPEQPKSPGFKGATLPANEHKSDVRLVVVSHGNVTSAPASYHIVCTPKVNPGISTPSGMAIPPRGGIENGGDPSRPVITAPVPNRTAHPAGNGADRGHSASGNPQSTLRSIVTPGAVPQEPRPYDDSHEIEMDVHVGK